MLKYLDGILAEYTVTDTSILTVQISKLMTDITFHRKCSDAVGSYTNTQSFGDRTGWAGDTDLEMLQTSQQLPMLPF
jgi:hypothetical protein